MWKAFDTLAASQDAQSASLSMSGCPPLQCNCSVIPGTVLRAEDSSAHTQDFQVSSVQTSMPVCLSLVTHAGEREGTEAKVECDEVVRMRQERATHFAGMSDLTHHAPVCRQ